MKYLLQCSMHGSYVGGLVQVNIMAKLCCEIQTERENEEIPNHPTSVMIQLRTYYVLTRSADKAKNSLMKLQCDGNMKTILI